jgi:LEA14-like dessication related protein
MKTNLFASLFLVSLFVSSCMVIKPVEVRKLDRVRTDMNVQQPSILFDVDVMNPNGFGVTLKSVDVSLGLGEKNLAGISIERHLRIPRKGTATLPVKLQPSYADLSAIAGAGLAEFLGGKKESLSIRGEIVIGKFLFRRKLRFSEQIVF